MGKIGLALCAAAVLLPLAARAEDPVTATALLADGYEVRAAIPSPAGPGLFLQKGALLFACFVSETPGSAALTTSYCKPVR